MNNCSYAGFRSNIFTDVHANDWTLSNNHRWDEEQHFYNDWSESAFYGTSSTTILDERTIKLVYNLLYAYYGNSHIASDDEYRFKQKVFATIYEYGPTWFKRTEIQDNLRSLDLQSGELFTGTKAIYNQALNPQTEPSTGSLEELEYINSQSTTGYKRSKLDAYENLWSLLKIDVTENFMKQFSKLFVMVVKPDRPLLYESEEYYNEE